MKKILVTGATGFVGSHALNALRDAPVEVIAACRSAERLPAWFTGEVRAGDMRDTSYVDSLPKGVDTVIHAAAWTSMYGHRKQERTLYLAPSLRLLDAVERAGVARFVFPSTHGAARPGKGSDARAPGHAPGFWPHLQVVVALEEEMRRRANDRLTMVNLRLGLFVGENYSLGLLPILMARLKTHLVPWVDGGRAKLPLIDGADIGQAFRLATLDEGLGGYEAFNILGPDVPTMRELVGYLHEKHGAPVPHFAVPFWMAFPFARLMRTIDPIVPWDPLIVPAIIHLIQDFKGSNAEAEIRLGYRPRVAWQDAVDRQIAEMAWRQTGPMRMRKAMD